MISFCVFCQVVSDGWCVGVGFVVGLIGVGMKGWFFSMLVVSRWCE